MGGRLRAVRVPAEIVDTLHKAFVKASQAPDMQDKFHKGGMVAPQQASVDDAKRGGCGRDGLPAARPPGRNIIDE